MKWPLIVRQVAGRSMEPKIMPKQFILASGWLRPKVGSVVVAKADGREVIKRVTAIDGNQVIIEGDNKKHSSKYIIKKSAIIGVRFG
ncbi:MAG: S24/S26 family peptidase [Candidatus Saccharimonadales bacterium]|nr:S24/S26 family peptidase [Candidatus Saccharimonadales bacterium]